MTIEMPLFPLNVVLFTDGRLPLRIFEPRYVDMISQCMRDQSQFGVVLILEGSDGMLGANPQQPKIADWGTCAEIVDFSQLPDGLLGIVASGRERFRIVRTTESAGRLLTADVELVPEEDDLPAVPAQYAGLVDVLGKLMAHPMVERLELNVDLASARSVSRRLAELLPLSPELKQELLTMTVAERLAQLQDAVERLS